MERRYTYRWETKRGGRHTLESVHKLSACIEIAMAHCDTENTNVALFEIIDLDGTVHWRRVYHDIL